MIIASYYFGNFVEPYGSDPRKLTIRPHPDQSRPSEVQYRFSHSPEWLPCDAQHWVELVDRRAWIPDLPEELRVSEGL